MKRIKTPRVIQMEALECGAASLSIVLGYYGRFVPLEVLRVDCGVSRDGSNVKNVMEASKKYALSPQGLKKSAEELRNEKYPAILFWGYKHFLVLEGFRGNKVYLNDPATGRRTIDYEEFKIFYSGIVITFTKEEHFKAGGKPKPLWKMIWNRLRVVPGSLLFLSLAGLGLLLPGFAMPALLMIFVDVFFIKNPWEWYFLGAVFFTVIFSICLTSIQQYCLTRINTKLSVYFSSGFLWHLLRLPMNFYNQRYHGEISHRTKLNINVVKALTNSIIVAVIDLLLIVFYGVVMFSYNYSIAAIAVAIAAINLIVMNLIHKARANNYACLQQDLGQTVGISIGGLQSIDSIKAQASENDFFKKWSGSHVRTINLQQEIGKKDTLLSTLPVLFQFIALAFLLWLGSLEVMQGNMTLGMLMGLQILQTNFLLPINRFVGFGTLIEFVKVDLDRLNDVLQNPVDQCYQVTEQKKIEKSRLEGKLEFRNVTFGYSILAPPLIDDLSFTIESGKRLAFVGPSGCGKSTIAKLASGLIYPWKGEILYEGIPINQIPKDVFTNTIAMVDQSIFIFEGSVRDNLTLWNPNVPEKILAEACKDAAIHEDIIKRPGSYDTHLIEFGHNLSGGQRQRLEIARAFLYNPTILILDEATSALDSKVEKQISDRLKQRGCSALVIAHRLSTIQDCDEIIVLDEGKVVQRGSHNELKNLEGIYQSLVMGELGAHE